MTITFRENQKGCAVIDGTQQMTLTVTQLGGHRPPYSDLYGVHEVRDNNGRFYLVDGDRLFEFKPNPSSFLDGKKGYLIGRVTAWFPYP